MEKEDELNYNLFVTWYYGKSVRRIREKKIQESLDKHFKNMISEFDKKAKQSIRKSSYNEFKPEKGLGVTPILPKIEIKKPKTYEPIYTQEEMSIISSYEKALDNIRKIIRS